MPWPATYMHAYAPMLAASPAGYAPNKRTPREGDEAATSLSSRQHAFMCDTRLPPALLSGRDIARPTTHDHRSRAARGAGRPDGRTAARRYETASELDRSAVRLSPAHGRWCTHHAMSAPIVTFIRRRGPQLASG
jgi:hypothetical protein